MKSIGILLAIGLTGMALSVPGMAAEELPSNGPFILTAETLFLRQQPLADLNDFQVKIQILSIESELERLFPKVLTEKGQKAFRQPLPWKPGEVLIGLNDDSRGAVMKRMGVTPTVPLAQMKAELGDLAAILVSAGGQSLTQEAGGGFFILTIDPGANPEVAAALIVAANSPQLRFAQADHVFRIGGPQLDRMAFSGTTLYIFSVGWGDCPAGCLHSHREYFELPASPLNPLVHVAATGEELPPSMRSLFLDEGEP